MSGGSGGSGGSGKSGKKGGSQHKITPEVMAVYNEDNDLFLALEP